MRDFIGLKKFVGPIGSPGKRSRWAWCAFASWLLVSVPAQHARGDVVIIEGASANPLHLMQGVWQAAAAAENLVAGVFPQSTLDSNAFFSGTEVLVVSSGVVGLTPQRVSTIAAFLAQGGSVYLQSEYLPTFDANQAFQTIVTNLGGNFSWIGTVGSSLAPVTVSGSLSSTPFVIPPLPYFWYGAEASSGNAVTAFLHSGQTPVGWTFDPGGSAGMMVTTTDQDWVNNGTSLELMRNILVGLMDASNPCNLSHGSGCAGSGGIVPELEILGCAAAGGQVTVSVNGALGGSSAILLLGLQAGSAPVGGGCSLNVTPLLPIIVGPIPLGGVGAGAGSASIPAALPASLPAGSVALQAFVVDSANPIGYANSNGLTMIIQ